MAVGDLHCGICGAARPKASCHVVELSDEERQILGTDVKECVYCKPCWRTLTNPVSGPAVMKGIVQARLRQLGVSDAEKFAQKYHAMLVDKIKNRPS